ncbi:MAG: hypothetical protein SF028_10405 [Candidatus Sumerlaeia bacterium]|nr:hypothetical protein [Candidatus Sumerlaeia bacterium]
MEQLEGSPFHAVIEQWNLDVPIKPLVAAIVKYRIAKSTRTASTREEFFGIEADFPFEVIALDCVRRRMGLSGCLHCDALKVFHPAVVPPPDDFHALPNEFFDAWQSEVMGPEKVQAALEEIRTAPFTQWPVRKPPTGAEILKMVTAKREEEELLDDVLPIPQLFHLDWKDGVDAGFDAITGALPEDQPFEWEHMGGSRFKLSFGGKSETVEVSSTQGDEALWGLDAVVAAEQLLKPLFEIRVTRETMGDDGLTFLLMEAKWWDTYRTKKGKHFSKTFAPLTELRKVSG